MNTPTPTDREIAEELTSVLRSEAERVTPAPALQQILTRAHEEGPTKSKRRRGRGWLPVIGGVVATAGLIAAAILIFGPGTEQRTTPPPAESCAVEVHEGCRVDFALYLTRPTLMTLVGTDVTVTSSGNVGLDAVRALLQAKSTDIAVNPWHGWDTTPPDSGPIAEVNSVTQDPGAVTVDFNRPLTTDMTSLQGTPAIGKRIIQQLVLTVQSALRTQSPIMITVNGKPADKAFGYQLAIPGTHSFKAQFAHWSWVEGIRPESPRQREAMPSPVTISGTSSTNEGNVRWEITTRAGKVVKQGFTTGGSFGEYLRYSFQVKLKPDDYTVKLWEPNMASGQEAHSGELFVVYLDFTVK